MEDGKGTSMGDWHHLVDKLFINDRKTFNLRDSRPGGDPWSGKSIIYLFTVDGVTAEKTDVAKWFHCSCICYWKFTSLSCSRFSFGKTTCSSPLSLGGQVFTRSLKEPVSWSRCDGWKIPQWELSGTDLTRCRWHLQISGFSIPAETRRTGAPPFSPRTFLWMISSCTILNCFHF